jgi:ADP-dependent NAD(P)H-hydrate dehydratase / NAD(P)H-hydrate epimerase
MRRADACRPRTRRGMNRGPQSIMKILTSEQMRNIDGRTTEKFGIPSLVLMENAAIAVAETLIEHYPEAGRVAIFCGTGNNGGDGFGAARHLFARGIDVSIHLLGDRSKISGDALANLESCDRMGLAIASIESEKQLELAMSEASRSDVIVDAILGTGLQSAASGIRAQAIVALRSLPNPVLAVDLPSGLDASRAAVPGPAIEAAVTVTFAAPKVAHVFSPAADCCGEIVVADISIPDEAVDAEGVTLSLTTPSHVLPFFAARPNETHKGTWGHVSILAGSAGRSGAAILSARGALRAGAGLVTVLTDAETAKIVDAVSIESMSRSIDREHDSIAEVLELINSKDAALAGPGLADEELAWAFVREVLPGITVPLVVDASALNAWPGRIESLQGSASRVLTPHPGELGRLLARPTDEIVADRIGCATEAAKRSGCVVVLKGHQTLIASPDGSVRVNTTGNPGMGAGGMGDVLGGMIATLLAHGHDAADAAAAAVWLHGYTADLLAEETSDIGMAALDLAESIPRAIGRLRG